MAITMTLMDLVEIYNQDNPAENPTVNEKIQYALPKLFDFTYPFFDETKRNDFETKFVKHFFMRQLGFETPALFKFQLDEALNLIMPYYNEFFKSQLLEYDPLFTYVVEEVFSKEASVDTTRNETISDTGNKDITRNATEGGTTTDKKTGTDSSNGNETIDDTQNHTGSVNTTTSSSDKYSDTPQAMISNSGSNEYLTNMRNISGKENVENNLTDTDDRTTTTTATTTYDTTVTKTIENTDDETIGETSKNDTTRNGNDLEKVVEKYTNTKHGITGNHTYPELIMKLREAIVNVYNLIFTDMYVKSLFIYIE